MQSNPNSESEQHAQAFPAVPTANRTGMLYEDQRQNSAYSGSLLTSFEDYLKPQNLSAITIQDYLTLLLHLIQWFRRTYGGEVTVIDLTPEILRQYKKHILHAKELTLRLGRQLQAIHVVSQWVEHTQKVATPSNASSQSRRSAQWLDKEQQSILMRAIKNDQRQAKRRYPKRWITRYRDGALVIVLLHSGLRLSEILRLQADDVQISADSSKLFIQPGQKNSQRIIPMNWYAHQALHQWRAVRPKNKFFWATSVQDQTQALSGRAIQRILNRFAKATEIKYLTPTVCRHTFARNLVSSGVRLEYVADLLGVRSLDAIRIYLNASEHPTC